MKMVITVPVWGHWVQPWKERCLPTLRAEAADIDAKIVVYTIPEDEGKFSGCGVETAALPQGRGSFDRADAANAQALNDAFAGGYAVAPLAAALQFGRGTFLASARRLEEGYRATIALCIPYSPPSNMMTCRELALSMVEGAGFLTWDRRSECSHPGHYAWRAEAGVLVRPIYIHPVLIAPTRAAQPSRAQDHFMTQEFLDDPSQVICLDTVDGLMAGIPAPSQIISRGYGSPTQKEMEPNNIATWMFNGNIRSWNLKYFRHHFWLGTPCDKIELESDSIVDDIVNRYEAMVG